MFKFKRVSQKQLIRIGLGLLIFLLVTLINNPTINQILGIRITPTISQTQIDESYVLVIKVIDGDTIEIENGIKVRYIGIDTPESVDPNRPDGCFGKEASDQNKQLVSGKYIRLEKDISNTDKYGRLLRYVYVGDIFVNEYLVKEGYAKVSTYPPDVKYQNVFREAEQTARRNNLGLWGLCPIPTTN